MKKLFSWLIFLSLYPSVQSAKGQCFMVPVDVQTLSSHSDLIVEAEIFFRNTFRGDNQSVYTLYYVKPLYLYKGVLPDSLFVVSAGGRYQMQITQCHPADELKEGRAFLFLRNARQISKQHPAFQQYELTASAQAKIEIQAERVFDVFNRYHSYDELSRNLKEITQQRQLINNVMPNPIHVKRATPVITSFSPSSRTAGTDSVITIRGSNFNSPRGSGFVGFRNANDGGSTFILPLSTDYISWTDTQIVVKVPTQAGTGTLLVSNSDPANTLSTATLTVPYNLINVTFSNVHYSTRLQGFNAGASLSFSINSRFNDSQAAKNDFINAVQAWRCKSLIHFDTMSTLTNISAQAFDSINVVSWDFSSALPLGVLGVATSTFLGCNSGTDWFVMDLDLIFNDIPFTSYTWEYGTGTPGGTQFDFESVAVHELGHGHQLGHVIDASKVMHYALSNGQKKTSISTQDSFAAIHVMGKNVSSICGLTPMTALNSSSCAYVALPLDFIRLSVQAYPQFNYLEWQTWQEEQVVNYSIQKYKPQSGYSEIAVVQAENKSTHQVYAYTDYFPQTDESCYRIMAKDKNNLFFESNAACAGHLFENYFTCIARSDQSIFVNNSGTPVRAHDIKIYDQLGREVEFTYENNTIRFVKAVNGLIVVVIEREAHLKPFKFIFN